MDQAFYAGHRAAGQKEVMQVGWVYQHPVDFDELNRFHGNLCHGLLGRLIERSPLPFGRYRWVLDPRPPKIAFADAPRPPAEISDWFDECTQLPIDPEAGPGWRLSVLPVTDGSTAINLVLSHYVIDGIGAALAVTEAAVGHTRDLGYPPARSRSRLRALLEDPVDAARDAPAVARAFVTAVRETRRNRLDARAQAAPPVAAGHDADDPVTAPSVRINIPMDEWNARAASLGGTNSTLAAGLTAKLDHHMGRQHSGTGDITMLLTVNDRADLEDVRAVAVSFARLHIDPTNVTTDLRDARAAIKTALTALRDTDDVSAQLVPLTPFTPQWAWRQMVDHALSDPEHPAVCSNLGDTGPAAVRPDGTLCDSVFARGASQHLTRRWLERMGGQLHLYYGTTAESNTIVLDVCAYHSGSVTTKPQLRELVARTLAEFDLTGEID